MADAHLVSLRKAGGAVLIGKLATWEFALGAPSWEKDKAVVTF